MKNKKYLLLSFLIPLILYSICFYHQGFDKIIISGDGQAQYYPLFHYLKGMLEGQNSIFYSFSKSLGGTMYGTFFYYLSSFFNIFLLFVDKAHILNFMSVITIVKLSLCGLTMYIYMSKKFNSNSYILLFFSLLYSFSGYNLNYFTNIMWLDIVLLAPLVLLGIDRIINNKSPLVYIIFLTISIISNYYIAYMLCIFCVLYFIYEMVTNYTLKDKEKIIKICKTFLISSLLSGLICSFFIVPCLIEVFNYTRTSKESILFDYNIFNLFANTYIGSFEPTNPFNTGAINIYCGILTLPLVYFYLRNNNVQRKERLTILLIILLMILPCFIKPLNTMWHLFTTPVGYNYRYSFLLILFFILIAYKSYTNLNIRKYDILYYLLIYISYSLIIIFLIYFKNYYPYLDYIKIWITNLFLIIYLFILYKFSSSNKLNIFISFILITEIIINLLISFNSFIFTDIEIILNKQQLEDYLQIEDITRINLHSENLNLANLSLIYNYSSLNSFLSTTSSNTYKTVYNFESANVDKNFYFNYVNPSYIQDSLLGVERIVKLEEDYNLLKTTELSIGEDLFHVYKNDNALSLGYIVQNQCNNLELQFPYDEKMLNCLINEENQFYKLYLQNDKKYELKKGYAYIYYPDINLVKNIEKLNIDNKKILYYDNNYIIVNFEEDTIYTIPDWFDPNEFKIYYFDYQLFNEKIEILKQRQLNYEIDKNKLIGEINYDGMLLLSIPYEQGLKVSVNNEQKKVLQCLDSLACIDLNNSINEIEVSYEQSGFKIGILISTLSFISIIIYIKMYNKKC